MGAGSRAVSTCSRAIACRRWENRSTTTICTQTYRDPVIEVGGDVVAPLAGGAIKFVALATRRKRHDVDDYIQHDGLLTTVRTVNGGFLQSCARSATRRSAG